MTRGTRETLERLRFPMGDRTDLMLRPRDLTADKDFKVVASRRINRKGTVLAQFENEPANANAMLPLFPEALHFLVGSVHSDAPVTPADALISTPDFTFP